jgi:flavin-binding protein dodecin
MSQSAGKKTVAPRTGELFDEVRESARAGQEAANKALRKFRDTVDQALPASVQPLRKKIVDAAIELADQLVSAQYKFHRSIVQSADRALSKSDGEKE